MEKIALEIVKFLAGEAASNALQRLLPTKSLEEKVEQALGDALDKVARGNEIWKDKVAIQQKVVIDALVWMVDSPDASIPPTNLFDKNSWTSSKQSWRRMPTHGRICKSCC